MAEKRASNQTNLFSTKTPLLIFYKISSPCGEFYPNGVLSMWVSPNLYLTQPKIRFSFVLKITIKNTAQNNLQCQPHYCLRDQIINNKLMYIPNDNTQNFIFGRLQLVAETIGHSTKSPKLLGQQISKRYNKLYGPMFPFTLILNENYLNV